MSDDNDLSPAHDGVYESGHPVRLTATKLAYQVGLQKKHDLDDSEPPSISQQHETDGITFVNVTKGHAVFFHAELGRFFIGPQIDDLRASLNDYERKH